MLEHTYIHTVVPKRQSAPSGRGHAHSPAVSGQRPCYARLATYHHKPPRRPGGRWISDLGKNVSREQRTRHQAPLEQQPTKASRHTSPRSTRESVVRGEQSHEKRFRGALCSTCTPESGPGACVLSEVKPAATHATSSAPVVEYISQARSLDLARTQHKISVVAAHSQLYYMRGERPKKGLGVISKKTRCSRSPCAPSGRRAVASARRGRKIAAPRR